jgi:hypothetical protein
MIRYRPSTTASSLNDALAYIENKIFTLAAEGWQKSGDIVITESRNAASGTRVFRGATTLIREEV